MKKIIIVLLTLILVGLISFSITWIYQISTRPDDKVPIIHNSSSDSNSDTYYFISTW